MKVLEHCMLGDSIGEGLVHCTLGASIGEGLVALYVRKIYRCGFWCTEC